MLRGKLRQGGGKWAIIATVLVLIVVLLSAPTSSHHIPAITVNSTADGADILPGNGICETATGNGLCTLRAAVQEAQVSNHPVAVPAGTYVLTLGHIEISQSLGISGAGSGKTIIDGNNASRIFDITPGAFFVDIQRLTIQNGKAGPGFAGHGHGGGVHNHGIFLQLVNVALINNQSANFWEGGGLKNVGGSTSLVYNVTVSGNRASTGGGGIDNAGTLDMLNVTISNNTAGSTGGGISTSGSVTFSNTIIGGNTAQSGTAHDCAGSLTSEGYNLVQNRDGCTIGGTATGNQIGVSPMLAALDGDHTHPLQLQPTSPALDAGNPAPPGLRNCMTTDQRLISRPQDGNADGTARCDIGAFEREGPSAPPSNTPTPTPSPTPTTTRTPTRTPRPTVTRTPTPRPTVTRTPTPRPTVTRTPTPRPTVTRTPSASPTVTRTPTTRIPRAYLPLVRR